MRSMVEGSAAMGATDKAYKRARQLRREMSLPEVLLWQLLRTRPRGLKFRRQHPRDLFAIDFYCPAARLVIEVDGKHHDMGDQPEQDAARDAWLAGSGLETIRVPASDILVDPAAVADSIAALCDARRKPLHRPADGPPPHGSAAGRID